MTSLHLFPDTGIATLKWTFTGKTNPISTTLGFQSIVAGTSPATIADDFYGHLTNTGCPCDDAEMLTQYAFTGVDVIMRDTGGTLVGGASSGPTVVGTKSSATSRMIMNTSLVVKKRTGLIGHQFRGRCYWPCTGMTEGEIDALGNIDPASLATSQATFDALWALLSISAHIDTSVLHTSTTTLPTSVTSLTVEGMVGTQRRRMR